MLTDDFDVHANAVRVGRRLADGERDMQDRIWPGLTREEQRESLMAGDSFYHHRSNFRVAARSERRGLRLVRLFRAQATSS